MKKNFKRSLLLSLVFALFSVITLTTSAEIHEARAVAISCLLGHEAVATPAAEATCTTSGSYGGTYCSKCGTVLAESTVVPAKGHVKSDVSTLKPATTEFDGEYSYACVDCNMVMESGVISKIDSKSVVLSTAECVYNGKVRTPSIKIKDIQGKLLVENQDYTITYASGRKNPGKYIVTVTFIGNYEGASELAFTILPKAVSDLKTTAQTSNSITLSWGKVTGATGYQVYKYNSSTKKYEKIKSLTTNSYKATGLKDNATYKFKVRAYTKSTDGTTLYGEYSSVYSAKTKVAYGVTFSGSSATIYVGETKQLKATTTPADKKLTWKSSDTSVVKVSSTGKVTAVKNGTATITASFKYKDKTYKGTYKITVKKPIIKLSETSATITEGETLKFTATTDPSGLKVTWKSSNTAVATVSSTGKVTAKKSGAATITASITYKGTTYKATYKITVKTIAENIATLKNYIKKNGSTVSEYDYKYITFSDYDPEYDAFIDFDLIYYYEDDRLEFRYHDDAHYDGISEIIYVSALLNKNCTYVDYYFNVRFGTSYGEYNATAEDTIKISQYTDKYSVYDDWKYNTFPSEFQSYLNKLPNVYTGIAMSNWNRILIDTIGVGLNGIGFTNYH